MKQYEKWMPLYIADYLADTSRLTLEQHGAYLLLIMDYWRNGAPPDDPVILARIVGASPEQWRAIAPVLHSLFHDEIRGGSKVWAHKRIDEELKRLDDRAKRIAAFWRSLPTETKKTLREKRRAAELSATPAWLTKEHFEEIEEIYKSSRELSRTTRIKHEVDHIVPLQGRDVCGLHVPWNLKPIPSSVNRSKGRSH